MLSNLAAALPLFLQFLLSVLASSSGPPCGSADRELSKLTEQALRQFAVSLMNDPTGSLAFGFQCDLARDYFPQKACLRYLIGSAAVLGRADEGALSAMRSLCRTEWTPQLTDMLGELNEKNDCDAVVRYIAKNARWYRCQNPFRHVITELMRDDWKAVQELVVKTMAALKDDINQCDKYYFMLRHMPTGKQYEMVRLGEVSLKMIGSIYYLDKFDPQLRDIFFLAKCSQHPYPALRDHIMCKASYFKQFSPGYIPAAAMAPRSDGSTDASADVWRLIRTFLDIETLMLVWPLVCTSWNKLHPKILMCDTKVQDLYMHDLSHVQLCDIYATIPWKRYLVDGTCAFGYLGQCIASGALDRAQPDKHLQREVDRYLSAAINSAALMPTLPSNSTLYSRFVKLFETVHKHHTFAIPTLGKPIFLTDAEYRKAIRYFAYEKRWILKLPDSWVINNLSQLFEIIEEDEALMKELIIYSLNDFKRLSVAVITQGQVGDISERLARLILSQEAPFERLVEPVYISPDGYYDFIAESGLFLEMAEKSRGVAEFSQLAISLVLSFKNKPDRAEKFVALIASRLQTLGDSVMEWMKWWFGDESLRAFASRNMVSSNDIELVESVVERCGLLKKSHA